MRARLLGVAELRFSLSPLVRTTPTQPKAVWVARQVGSGLAHSVGTTTSSLSTTATEAPLNVKLGPKKVTKHRNTRFGDATSTGSDVARSSSSTGPRRTYVCTPQSGSRVLRFRRFVVNVRFIRRLRSLGAPPRRIYRLARRKMVSQPVSPHHGK